jgi:hypothetical protein
MTPTELDALARRASSAGHNSIASHYQACLLALVAISNANSGPWGRVAYDALNGRGEYTPDNNHA